VYSLVHGRLHLLTTELTGPNGIAFSPDEKYLYIGDWDEKKKVVMRYVSLEDLRQTLATRLEEHIRQVPASGDRPAFEPFHFCEAIEVAVPVDRVAHNLAELADGIRSLGLQTLHYHFITSRLRLRLKTNDFSNWIERSLQLGELAGKLNRIDFYTNTLGGVRAEILHTLASWITA